MLHGLIDSFKWDFHFTIHNEKLMMAVRHSNWNLIQVDDSWWTCSTTIAIILMATIPEKKCFATNCVKKLRIYSDSIHLKLLYYMMLKYLPAGCLTRSQTLPIARRSDQQWLCLLLWLRGVPQKRKSNSFLFILIAWPSLLSTKQEIL